MKKTSWQEDINAKPIVVYTEKLEAFIKNRKITNNNPGGRRVKPLNELIQDMRNESAKSVRPLTI